MGKVYFGFALADSMFVGDCTITRRAASVEEVKAAVAQGVESCCNVSHLATINAMRSRFGIDILTCYSLRSCRRVIHFQKRRPGWRWVRGTRSL